MARDAVIRIRVTDEQKEQMREFVENERWCSGFSDYFRGVIKADMKGELRGGADVDTGEIVGDIVEELEPLKQEVETVNEKVGVVMESVSESEDEVVELATELYELLPIGQIPTLSAETVINDRNLLSPTADLVEVQRLSDPQSWALFLDESEDMVRRAFNYLREFYPDVGAMYVTQYDDDGVDIDDIPRLLRTPQDGKNWIDDHRDEIGGGE